MLYSRSLLVIYFIVTVCSTEQACPATYRHSCLLIGHEGPWGWWLDVSVPHQKWPWTSHVISKPQFSQLSTRKNNPYLSTAVLLELNDFSYKSRYSYQSILSRIYYNMIQSTYPETSSINGMFELVTQTLRMVFYLKPSTLPCIRTILNIFSAYNLI